MTLKTPFSFRSPRVYEAWAKPRSVDLKRLKAGCDLKVMFGAGDLSRLIVPVHWPKGSPHSLLCACTDKCVQCSTGGNKTFHLYAGAYLYEEEGRRVLLDLGTTMGGRWLRQPPDFNLLHRITRKEAHGPILCEPLPFQKVVLGQWSGWDIADDVQNVFRGRLAVTTDGEL